MAGTAVFEMTKGDNISSVDKMLITFTGDHTTGAFPAFTFSTPVNGYITRIARMPGTPAPDANNTVVVTDDEGVDLLQTMMTANGSATVGDHLVQSIAVNDTLTVTPTGNTTGDAVLTVALYLDHGTPTPRS